MYKVFTVSVAFQIRQYACTQSYFLQIVLLQSIEQLDVGKCFCPPPKMGFAQANISGHLFKILTVSEYTEHKYQHGCKWMSDLWVWVHVYCDGQWYFGWPTWRNDQFHDVPRWNTHILDEHFLWTSKSAKFFCERQETGQDSVSSFSTFVELGWTSLFLQWTRFWITCYHAKTKHFNTSENISRLNSNYVQHDKSPVGRCFEYVLFLPFYWSTCRVWRRTSFPVFPAPWLIYIG